MEEKLENYSFQDIMDEINTIKAEIKTKKKSKAKPCHSVDYAAFLKSIEEEDIQTMEVIIPNSRNTSMRTTISASPTSTSGTLTPSSSGYDGELDITPNPPRNSPLSSNNQDTSIDPEDLAIALQRMSNGIRTFKLQHPRRPQAPTRSSDRIREKQKKTSVIPSRRPQTD